MSEKDLLELRLFNANYFILTYLEIGRPLLDFAHSNGFHPIKIIADISKNINKNKYINLYNYCEKFINSFNHSIEIFIRIVPKISYHPDIAVEYHLFHILAYKFVLYPFQTQIHAISQGLYQLI